MNGKRAKALKRIRAGVANIEDIIRLSRTEFTKVSEPKPLVERKRKKINPPTAVAMAVRGWA